MRAAHRSTHLRAGARRARRRLRRRRSEVAETGQGPSRHPSRRVKAEGRHDRPDRSQRDDGGADDGRVTITPSGKATAGGGTFTFPITGGSIVYKKGNHGKGKGAKTKLLAGYILHAGSGLTLTKTTLTGPLSATISDFRITLSAGKTGRIDVKVGKSKLKLATLSGVAINATSKSVSATATLTPAAVTALNSAFATTLSKSGAALGTIVITPTF
jgi:hypothetical protein